MNLKDKLMIAGYLFLMFVMTIGTCNNKKAVVKLQNQVDSLRTEISQRPTLKQLQIENLQNCKRILYDWNTVVRSSVRPDDRMNQYDQEIKKLQN